MQYRKTISSLLLLISLAFSQANAGNEISTKLSVSSGYPYQDLVLRFDQVKIKFIQADAYGNLECQVQLDLGEQRYWGSAQTVTGKAFNETPLKACIDRTEAKFFLAKTFS